MSRETMQIGGGSNLKQTMLQGFNAMAGKDVPSYTLLFLDPTKSKMKGEYMNVVVPHVEVGRSPKCAIRYGEEFPTVSRVHASIQSIGKQVVIKHLGTNPTLVNRQPIYDTAVLQNGDEVQFSMEGPRLRFNTSALGTSSMKFTQRMALYTSQALAPYKRGLVVLSSLLVLTVAAFAVNSFIDKRTIEGQGHLIDQQEKDINDLRLRAAGIQDSLNSGLASSDVERKKMEQELRKIQSRINNTSSINTQLGTNNINLNSSKRAANFLKKHEKDIYLIICKRILITLPGRETIIIENTHIGTGFLTTDGRFITARHVITPWVYPVSDEEWQYNGMEQLGAKIIAEFIAISPTQDRIEFTSNEMKMSDSKDVLVDGFRTCPTSETDWAYMRLNKRGIFKPDNDLSEGLEPGDELFVSGYQHVAQTQDRMKGISGISPNFSRNDVAKSGLSNGVIQVTNRNFGSGSSGAPVIAEKNGEYVLVGIAVAGVASEQGLIVPVSNLR